MAFSRQRFLKNFFFGYFSDRCFAEKNQDGGVYVSQGRQEEEKEKTEKGFEEKGERHPHNERPKDKKPDNKVNYFSDQTF